MGILDTTASCFVVSEDLLDFTLECDGGEETGDNQTISKGPTHTAAFSHGTKSGSFPEFAEEELEWLSNKDAFPSVETCFGILSDNPELVSSHHSPVSVLENGNGKGKGSTVASCCGSLAVPTNFPVRARSSRRRRKRRADCGELLVQQKRVYGESGLDSSYLLPRASSVRRCMHCQVDNTPQWRAGPMGPKTLCNACGVRYKSGRLVPEYRPANSPTFSSALHSNSHRKVVEMRKKKQVATGGGVW
ncbi:gata transcription factor 1 [Phtheirospermum japonicum]|uniref:Gata transcription factor 1 n=1 Tax=Phtheirospermum japonicum TaxID=374723 RepID=A0A830CAB3_9LAMI|nr:gata transcription factor 1 [Phtheirospermum japonicum]